MRLQAEQAFQRSVRPVAFVFVGADLGRTGDLVGRLIEVPARYLHGSNFFFEKAFLLGPSSALLAEQRIFVLRLTADVVAFGHHFSGVAHHHVDSGKRFFQARIGTVVAHGHADALNPAANDGVRALVHDLVRGHGNGLQSGRAEAVDGGPGHGSRQSGQHGCHTCHVVSLRAVRLAAAQDDVFNFFADRAVGVLRRTS